MDRKNFALGILSITAMVLLVGIVTISTRPEPAAAAGMTVTGGDYVFTVGALNVTEELLYVVDSAALKMNVYTFDSRRGAYRVWSVDLAEMRRQTGGQPEP